MNCRQCYGNCNKKGLPSVMKNSMYCQNQLKIDLDRPQIFSQIYLKVTSYFADKKKRRLINLEKQKGNKKESVLEGVDDLI